MDTGMSSENNSEITDNETKNKTGNSVSGEERKPSIVQWIGWIFLGMFIIMLAGIAMRDQLKLKSQHLGESPPVYGEVPAFTFTDDTNTSFGLQQLKGRIWVVDFVFTRCGFPCPILTKNMSELQNWLDEEEMGNVKLITVTVDPEFDTPEVLTAYGKKFGANFDRWKFLTGSKETIYDFILKGFDLLVEENPEGTSISQMFIHSDKFVLIDRDGGIRGYYGGQSAEDLEKLRLDIRKVSRIREPEPKRI